MTPLRSWFLSDGILDINPHTSRPVPLSMPTVIPPMWFEDDKIAEGRRAEKRRHNEAVKLLHNGHPELASRMLADLRSSLEDRLREVLYTEADLKFVRGDYQSALELLNHRQLLSHQDVPDYRVHWMCGLCLANLGRLQEAVLHVQLAKRHVTCARSALHIRQLLSRLRRQLDMPDWEEEDLWTMPSDNEEGDGGGFGDLGGGSLLQ